MESTKRHKTIFNPGVAMTFFVRNLITGEKAKATTLSLRDEDCRPWRSPKGTKEGEQFFKMKIGSKDNGLTYLKFMNSNLNDTCLSEDKTWIFEGERIDGTFIPKVDDICRSKQVIRQQEKLKKKSEPVDTNYNIQDYTSAIYDELVAI